MLVDFDYELVNTTLGGNSYVALQYFSILCKTHFKMYFEPMEKIINSAWGI
jgi:hypothetical protein